MENNILLKIIDLLRNNEKSLPQKVKDLYEQNKTDYSFRMFQTGIKRLIEMNMIEYKFINNKKKKNRIIIGITLNKFDEEK